MYFHASSCISSLGNSAEMSFLAYDAGIMSGKPYEGFFCKNDKPATLALVPDGLLANLAIESQLPLQFSTSLIRRMALLHLAIEDLLEQIEMPQSCALIWLEHELLSRRSLFPIALLKEQCYKAGLDIDEHQFIPLNVGRSGGIAALHYANEIIASERAENVLIVSATSPIEHTWLEALDEDGRLKNEDAKDAFIPGEMGACLLLTKVPTGQSKPIRLSLPEVRKSANHWFNNDDTPREAMAMSWQRLASDGRYVDTLVSSFNGELYWGRELSIALARNPIISKNLQHHYHPAEAFGDVDAAAGLFQLAWAAQLLKKKSNPSRVLVCASSDGPYCAASLVESTDR